MRVSMCAKKKRSSRTESAERLRKQSAIIAEIAFKQCYADALQIIGREMSVEELVTEVEKDVGFLLKNQGAE